MHLSLINGNIHHLCTINPLRFFLVGLVVAGVAPRRARGLELVETADPFADPEDTNTGATAPGYNESPEHPILKRNFRFLAL